MINLYLDNLDIHEKKTKSFANLVKLKSFIVQKHKDLNVNIYIKSNDEIYLNNFINNLNPKVNSSFKNIYVNDKLLVKSVVKDKPKKYHNFFISYDLKIKGIILNDLIFLQRLNALISKVLILCPNLFFAKKLIDLIFFKSKIRVLKLKIKNKINNKKFYYRNIFLLAYNLMRLSFLARFSPFLKNFSIYDQNLIARITITVDEFIAIFIGLILRTVLTFNYYLILLLSRKAQKKEVVPLTNFEELIKSKVIIIRWNDGETALLYGRSIYFQRTSIRLIYELFKILLKYRTNNKNFFLALPNEEFGIPSAVQSRFISFFKKDKICDSTAFRFNRLKYQKFLVTHSNNFDSTLFVSSQYDKPFFEQLNSCIHLPTPSANAFYYVDYLLNIISSYLAINQNFNPNSKVLILFALGPTSKVLIYKLSQKFSGSQFLDLGHILI